MALPEVRFVLRSSLISNSLCKLYSTHVHACPSRIAPNSVLCILFFGLFSTNCTEYKQCKLLVAVHVCFGTRMHRNCRVNPVQSFSLVFVVVRFMLLHDCQRLKNLCKLMETIVMPGLTDTHINFLI